MNALSRWTRRLTHGLFAITCFGVAGYAYSYLYTRFSSGDPFAVKFAELGLVVALHFFAGATALAIVPIQLSKTIRQRLVGIHRTVGMVYVVCVMGGAVSGLIMSTTAYGGWPTGAGFLVLSLLWALFTGIAFFSIIRGDFAHHRRFMLRSAALTTSAITLRIILGVGLSLEYPFQSVYTFAAWGCWLINLGLVEIYLRWPERGTGWGSRRAPV